MSGEAISKESLESLELFGLDMESCHGQEYGNMAGRCSSAAAKVYSKFPEAPNVHCGSHAFNLCIASACNIQVVRSMMSHVSIVSQFSIIAQKGLPFGEKNQRNIAAISIS